MDSWNLGHLQPRESRDLSQRPTLDLDPIPPPPSYRAGAEMDVFLHYTGLGDQSQIGTLPSTDPSQRENPKQKQGEVVWYKASPPNTKDTYGSTLHDFLLCTSVYPCQ